MPSNQTANYALNQWSKDDRVLMEDFNADNAKIDAALSGLAQTAAAHGEVLAGLSNCRVHFTSYVGNGVIDVEHSPRIPLPGVPKVLIVMGGGGWMFHLPETGNMAYVSSGRLSGFFGVKWEGGTAILEQHTTNESSQMNSSNITYYVIAVYSVE